MRTRRFFQKNKTYEICLRTRKGLPFVPLKSINHILKSCMAKANQDKSVKIDDYLWMPNHLHLLVFIQNEIDFIHFYTELMKRITDSFKSLLGLEQLNLWENRPVIMEILDVEKYIERKIYFYSNPLRANLVDKIDEYPGLSSWQGQISNQEEIVEKIKWTKPSKIKKISNHPSEREDLNIIREIVSAAVEVVEFKIYPNICLNGFGMSEYQRDYIANYLKSEIKKTEERLCIERRKASKKCLGVRKLKSQPLNQHHSPKNKERRIFFLTSVRDLASEYLELFYSKIDYLKKVIELKIDDWPEGLFRPGLA